ncbi:hypothetical protein ACL6C3_16845 [Capilliphycus salinus ALCB114379]|uniref:hypothetical protein n=1 Tax=Capilliphycus salinus TaxID=2768948 RepID=UPI0039A612CF
MGKRVGVVSGENDWTKYAYTASAISKRTGLTRREIEQMRREARQEVSDSIDINERVTYKPDNRKRGIGEGRGVGQLGRKTSPFSLSFGKDGVGFGIGGGGFGVTKNPGGGGSVSFPGGMKMEVVNKGCYVVKLFYIFGQYSYSDIDRKPGCDDDGGGNDGNSNENDPPHCGGKGSPAGLIPECLRGTGKVVNFFYFISRQYDAEGDDKNGKKHKSEQKSIFESVEMDLPNKSLTYTRRRRDYRIAADKVNSDADETESVTRTFSQIGSSNRYRGTLEDFEAGMQRTSVYWNQTIAQSVPGSISRNDGGYIGNTWIDPRKFESSAWVIAVTDDPLGASCNPKGDEGCSKGSRGKGKPPPPNDPKGRKPPGGRKPPFKGEDKGDDMNCCKKLMANLGLDKFPGEVPPSLLDTEDKPPRKIETLVDLLLYLMESLDERLGKYPIDVEIEDVDPLKKGKQSEVLTFPNIAEMLAESYGLQMKTALDSQVNQTMITNLLIENGLQKAALTRIENVLDEFIEYFGWDVKESTTEIDIPYTPNKGNYDELLKRSKLEVKRIDRKIDKDNPAFDQIMEVLLEAAAIVKQVNWRKINPNGNVASQIADYARLGLDIYREVKDKKGDDWDEFKKMVENGYGQTKPGEVVDKSDLPVIREIEND